MTDEQILDALRDALTEATEREMAAHADVARYEAALDALGSPIRPAELPPAKPPAKKPASSKRTPARKSKYDYAEVAAVARHAIEIGESATAAVAGRYGVKAAMAQYLVSTARKLGHDTGRPAPQPTAPPAAAPEAAPAPTGPAQVPGRFFECDACGHRRPSISELTQHTLAVHGRAPYPGERKPVAS